MSRDEDKLIRQLSLLSFLLSQARPFTAREVQESVEGYSEMSDDTFARRFHGDRADLAKIGIEIKSLGDVERAESQVYLLPEEDYRLPIVEFAPAELRALALALAALDGRFAYARPLRLALTAISQGRPDPVCDELEQLPVVLAPDEDAQRAGKQLARLEDAVTRGKTVCFLYPSTGASLEERTLDPYSLFLIQGRWYVVGSDNTRRAIRTFRVGRIQGTVRFLTEKMRDFSIPADYRPGEYRARPPWLIGPVQGTATITVSDDLAWWVTRLEPHVTRLGDDGDGCTRFSVAYADEQVLLSWVVGLGGCGELLEPPRLRERLRHDLQEVCRAHEGTAVGNGEAPDGGGAYGRGAAAARRPARSRPPERRQGKSGPIAPEHLARTIALLHYLVDERKPELVTWRSLEDDLGLTRAEVETDLALINLVNFGGGTYALTAETGDEGVHVVRDVMADTFAHPARLSPVMARALLLALDLLGDAVALDGMESINSVREKVCALVGSDAERTAIIVDDVLPPDHEIVEALNRAIRDGLTVTIEYFTSSRQELSERQVEPYLLFRSRDGWYLEAHCLRAGGQRTFKLERIRSARPTGAGFLRRPEIDLTLRQTGQAFSPSQVATWATMRFHPRWRMYLEERGIDCELAPDGSLKVQMPYLDERWMARETTRYLGDAALERPASARQLVRELAGALAVRYGTAQPIPSATGRAGGEA
jgi:predicted DNA-binding transcriptional regulator YafY